MTGLPLLPLALYGIHLALRGDPLLLILSAATGVIWLLPILLEPRNKPLVEVAQNQWHRPEGNRLETSEGITLLFPSGAGVIYGVEGAASDLLDFFESFSVCLDQEVWVLSEHRLRQAESMKQLSLDENRDLLSRFMTDFEKRSQISFPVNLFVIEVSSRAEEISSWIESLENTSSLRIFYSGKLNLRSDARLLVEQKSGVFRISCNSENLTFEAFMRNLSFPGENANQLRDQGISSSELFNLIGNSGGKHSSPGSNKPKRFNLPLGRGVIDKAKASQTGFSTKNQISLNPTSEVRGSNPITDITSRLTNLGHGI